jgi:hypothetical protein
MSVGLQGSCILILDPDRFDLTVGGRRRLFSWTRTTLQLLLDIITYSRLPFSCRLPFKIYHWLFNSWECPHLFVLRSLVRIQSFIPTLSLWSYLCNRHYPIAVFYSIRQSRELVLAPLLGPTKVVEVRSIQVMARKNRSKA